MAVINGDYSLTQPSLVNDVSNQPSKVKSVNTPTKVADRIPIFASIVKEIVEKHFSTTIGQIPNYQFYILMTIALESSWQVQFSWTHSSRGGYNPKYLSSIQNQPAVASFLRANPYDANAKLSIEDSVYAHSLGQVMGWYFIRGTNENKATFGKKRPVVGEYGLEVEMGTRVTSLFPDNMTGVYRAIASCLIIYEEKYLMAMRNPITKAYSIPKGSKADAAKIALGLYCGSLTKPDSLGNTGNARISSILSGSTSSSASAVKQLASIGITIGYTSFTPVDLANASLRTTKTMGSVGNTGQTTASTTTPPNNYAGCG